MAENYEPQNGEAYGNYMKWIIAGRPPLKKYLAQQSQGNPSNEDEVTNDTEI